MGFIYVTVIVHGQKASKSLEMLVDTGSTYIVLDPDIIRELEPFETPYEADLTLADNRKIKAKLFHAVVEAEGRKGAAFIAQVQTPKPLLGVYALETLGFKVNPRTGTLEEMSPEGGYLLPTNMAMKTREKT